MDPNSTGSRAIGLRNELLPQPAFDPRATPLYALLLVEIALALSLCASVGMSFENDGMVAVSIFAAILVASSWPARRAGWTSFATWSETVGLTYLLGFVGWVLLYPLTVFCLPYADAWLSRADDLLGFQYVPTFRLAQQIPGVAFIYETFAWQPMILLAALAFTEREDRSWHFARAVPGALALTTIGHVLAPAIGPHTLYGIMATTAPHVEVINAIRSGTRVITPDMLVGLVSFPSFHTASAVIYAWSVWPIRRLRWLAVLLNSAVIFAALTAGNHYLVDIFAGIGVAAMAISLTAKGRLGALLNGLRG